MQEWTPSCGPHMLWGQHQVHTTPMCMTWLWDRYVDWLTGPWPVLHTWSFTRDMFKIVCLLHCSLYLFFIHFVPVFFVCEGLQIWYFCKIYCKFALDMFSTYFIIWLMFLLTTRSSEHFATFLLAPAEGWWPFLPLGLCLSFRHMSQCIWYTFSIYRGSISYKHLPKCRWSTFPIFSGPQGSI